MYKTVFLNLSTYIVIMHLIKNKIYSLGKYQYFHFLSICIELKNCYLKKKFQEEFLKYF